MKLTILVFFLILTSCAGIKLKDLNRVTSGMSQSQVKEILGEPISKKLSEGNEIFEYDLKDENGDLKPRIVVFQDREVVYFGKPSEFKTESRKQAINGATQNTNTVSPTINITSPSLTVSPVINISSPEPTKATDKRVPSSGNSYFHEIPTVDELKTNSNNGDSGGR